MIRNVRGKISEMEGLLFGFLTFMCIGFVLSNPASGSKMRTMVNSCHAVEPLFYNSPLKSMIPKHPVVGTNSSICSDENSRTCCTLDLEKELMNQVRENFRSLLYHNSRSVKGVLATTKRMLEEYMVELLRQSENKTLTFFRQVYSTMAVLSTDPIKKFYSEIIEQGTQNRDRIDIVVPLGFAVLNFFTGVFPLVYHHIVHPTLRDYSDDYKRCLRQTISEINPFGEVPKELSEDIGKTMKAVKVFLDALEIGTDVLNQTDSLFDSNANDKCHTELLRMSSCPKCQGLKAKPCAGYCLNVLRGCLTQFSTQLDLPWSAYVDSLQKLVVGNEEDVRPSSSHLIDNLENLIRTLDTKISTGVMEAMTNGKQLEEKVKKICGSPQWSDDDDQPLPADRVYNAQDLIDFEPRNVRVTPFLEGRRISKKLKESQNQLSLQLEHFLSSILKMKNFYENMAESPCSDDSFAETRDTADCWNGQMIGEYTKPVVAATVSAQKYNPEGKLSSDIGVSHLSDKLRGITQAIVGVLAPLPQSGDMYLQDEEGSGSEYENPDIKTKYPNDDEEEVNPDEEGSGSGDGPLDGDDEERSDVTHNRKSDKGKVPAPTGGSQRHFTSWSLLISAWVCRRYLHFYFVG